MQIRCAHCGIPFSLNQEAIHAALDMMSEQGLKHFDARCPQCRKVNRIPLKKLQQAAPDWEKSTSTETE
jgi:phage FluMu protein Com